LKFSWETDLDEVNTNVAVDVDEFARVHLDKLFAVIVSRDRALANTGFNKHSTMLDFATVCHFYFKRTKLLNLL
jgi:hypothetical protein